VDLLEEFEEEKKKKKKNTPESASSICGSLLVSAGDRILAIHAQIKSKYGEIIHFKE